MADPDPIKLSFSEAIRFFARKLNIPAGDIQEAENDWAFAIAGVTLAEMLSDFRATADRYIADGRSFGEFKRDFTQIAERYGWQPRQGVAWRANIVAQTNLRQAYAAGQWQQRQDPIVRAARPGLMWRHRDSPNARPHHAAMDGRVFEASKVDWSLPSGFGCRCRWFSVPAPDEGYFELSDRLPYARPDGSTVLIPAIAVQDKLMPVADPGFFYQPGQSPISSRPQLLQRMIERQPPTLARLIRRSLPARIVAKFLPQGFGG